MIVQDYTNYTDIAKLLKVLAHPVRLCIVSGLLGKECNVTTMQGCLQLAQPTISQHLALLKKAGIIEGQRCGTEIVYRVSNNKVKALIPILINNEGEKE